MFIRYGVGLIGVTYVVLGLLGFVPVEWLNPMHTEGVGARYLLGLVAINWMHNLIHLGIGVSGVWASAKLERCRLWGRVVGVVLLVVFAVGMAQAMSTGFPADQLLLGLVPLNSPGHMLHLATGGLALYLGFARTAQPSQ
jgi:hypothetical protein